MNIHTDKKTIRDKAKRIRKSCALDEGAASQFKQNIWRVLEAHKTEDSIIAGYEKMHSEIDPAVLDIEYVLPQVIEGQKLLDFDDTAPDIFLVPLLAFDEKGHRMGYGGGYYDATLAFYKRLKQSVAIGIAYEEQLWSSPLPIEPHDVPLDYIVTPAAIRKF